MGRRRQRVSAGFRPVIEPVLQPLEYDVQGMANLWRPIPLVTADPAVQAGTPCVEATRIPTSTIAGLAHEGEDLEDIAFDLDLKIEQIEAARRFEDALQDQLLAGKGVRSGHPRGHWSSG